MAAVLPDGGLGHEQGLDLVDEAHPLILQSKEIGKYYTLPNLMIKDNLIKCYHYVEKKTFNQSYRPFKSIIYDSF